METISIVTLLAALIAAVASVYEAYQTRFSRFSSEKWWERKTEAYSRIIGALSDLVYYFEQAYEVTLRGATLAPDIKRDMEEHRKRGYLEVRKAGNVGAFLISERANQSLQKFWTEYDKDFPDDINPIEVREHYYSVAKICIKDLVSCAKEDLRV